ncbi:MAG TPA: NAD(P)-dependent alcohol dehydrogenase [Amycolatopsis sp.]|uniref:NAD(P)-dependent alcohol dehydrogenase n=1 Tax=Amycolatopsis sp. TaxID=37632 RepID=UPI002B467935|nr:NAD(P)-dependent alcohol dehydrogenase [Amycolatopsis sp.]HKS45836.1 NAD(P)-dependent alcohol dehydrogenase [Amycolatopsis sp.]
MKTTAAVLRTAGAELSLEDVEIENPRPTEVLVRLVSSGVCHTDLGVIATATAEQVPVVLGHEGAGVVEAVGDDVRGVEPGDHVVLTYNFCGSCDNCRNEVMVHCRDFVPLNLTGARLDGSSPLSRNGEKIFGHFFGQSSFSRRVIATEQNVVKVDRSLPLHLLGPLGCGVQTGAGAVLNTLDPEPGSSIAVFAAGSVGLSAVMAAAAVGCSPIIVVDPQQQRRDLARELGATHVINPDETDPVTAIHEITGTGARCSVECLGLPTIVRQALECLQSPGMCASVGFQGMTNELTIDQGHLLFGRTLVGVIEGDSVPAKFIPRMIELYQQGRFPFDKLITTLPFEQINEAIDAAHHGKLVKAVLTFES